MSTTWQRLLLAAVAFACACGRVEAGAPTLAASVPAPPASAAAPPAPVLPCPADMAQVGASCVDRYEAYLVGADAPSEPHSPYDRPRSDRRYRAVSSPGVFPQAYVSRFEADAACQNAGKRLCRADEWLRACRGSHDQEFPYGPTELPGRCNTRKPHLLPRVFGASTTLTFDLHYNSPKLNQEPGFLARTGEYSGCVNDYGLFDMVGNLHEWVADDVSRSLGRRIPLPYGEDRMGPVGSGAFMGGYFSSQGEHGTGCRYITTNHRPDYHDYSIGFRCCADAVTQRSKQEAPAASTSRAAPPASASEGGARVEVGHVATDAEVLRSMHAGFRRCLGASGDASPPRSLLLRAFVGPNGEVLNAVPFAAAGVPDALLACVVARVKAAQFDPADGRGRTIVIPVTFVP